MKDTQDEPTGGGGGNPEITIVAVAKTQFYIVEGEEYLDQLLRTDGVYPVPVLCIHFETIAAIGKAMGNHVNMSQYWTIHPEIIARLRNSKVLIEKAV